MADSEYIHAVSWKDCGPFLAYSEELDASAFSGKVQGLAITGAHPDLTLQRAVFLHSRLPRMASSADEWLISVRRAVENAAERNMVVVASTEGLGWEYSAWYAARCRTSTWIVLPPGKPARLTEVSSQLNTQLELDPDKTVFLMPLVAGSLAKTDRLHLRDNMAFAMAHHRFTIALRKNSYWAESIEEARGVDYRYLADYPSAFRPSWQTDTNWKRCIRNTERRDLLTHWTRGVYGPWSGETKADYFNSLTLCKSGNPRDGFATLSHIAAEGILRGEGRMVRGGTPVISFTQLDPAAALQGMRYRSALARWNYEPYGIALPRTTLEGLGAKPVIYGNRDDFNNLSPELKPFFQYIGQDEKAEPARGIDWSREREWRLTGDLDIASLKDQAMLIVPTVRESERLQEECDHEYRVISLEKQQI